LGFFSTLPGIWRALQCIRRYHDTRNVFPHLVNCGKYTCTILYYMTLSLYRLNKTTEMKALFIVFATINAIYCSIWDLIMDWSLGDPYAHYPFLRDVLGLKRVWTYYVAMIIDPILRFNWIFYAIFASDVQHSALLSFFVALSEIFRRAMWTIFRVENEHCTNVGRFRASRDIALPYDIASPESEAGSSKQSVAEGKTPTDSPRITSTGKTPAPHTQSMTPQGQDSATGPDLEAARTHETAISTATVQTESSGVRRRHRQTNTFFGQSPMLSRVGTILHTAHAQDFERKRKTPEQQKQDEEGHGIVYSSEDEEADGASDSDGVGSNGSFDEEGEQAREVAAISGTPSAVGESSRRT
jgi:xenotropic and polytropic retrovirus receptor 1